MSQAGILRKINGQRVYYATAVLAMLLLAVAFSALVSGATLNARSITLSSASTNAPASSVQYQVQFTPATAGAEALVIEFCTNSPLVGQACTAEAGTVPSVTNVATDTDGTAIVAGSTGGNKITATKTMAATQQTIDFEDITNPTADGVVYARILTFATSGAAEAYTSGTPGAFVDSGSVAMSFHDTISVSGTVLETMTFCVSGAAISENCSDLEAPTVVLGEETAPSSGIRALQAGTVSEGELFTQINTNAAGGVVVHLKSSAPCGGLVLAGTATCPITAAGTGVGADVDGTQARFGVKTAASPTTTGTNPVGTLQAVATNYGSSAFTLNYDEENETGVTSPFGDPFLNTNGLPATGQNLALTFAAAVTNATPAGTYSTDLSMIAVGTF